MQNRIMLWGVIFLFLTVILWRVASQPDFQLFGQLVPRVETSDKVVALTFDDGPTPQFTEAILGTLTQHQVKATFFLTGQEVEKNPQLVEQILAAGHQVGNHSYSHQRMVFKSPSFVASEIEKTDALLRMTGVTGEIVFRPPYGKKLLVLPWYLQQNQRLSVTWDVAPEDFPAVRDDAQTLAQFTIEQTKPGSIILLHVMYGSRQVSQQAVPLVIEGLKAAGYRFVTIDELLVIQNQARWQVPGKTQYSKLLD